MHIQYIQDRPNATGDFYSRDDQGNRKKVSATEARTIASQRGNTICPLAQMMLDTLEARTARREACKKLLSADFSDIELQVYSTLLGDSYK